MEYEINELNKEYDWCEKSFMPDIESAFADFFDSRFDVKLLGLSQNINFLARNESCFVTRINYNPNYELFFRITSSGVKAILNEILGDSKTAFNVNSMTELEVKILTSFNSQIYKTIKNILIPPDPKELKRTNFDTYNLTFFVKSKDPRIKTTGKIIITIPKVLIAPQQVVSSSDKFSENDFRQSSTFIKVRVGTTKFSLYELKHLEVDDVVVFESGKLSELELINQNGNEIIRINPNMKILIDNNNGGEEMADSQNLWDSIQVDMSAEFDAVKLSLGELKDIEKGLVVDLASIYDNNVTLKVEGKPVASGSLVIVNDHYGVKITEIYSTDNQTQNDTDNQNVQESEDFEETENYNNENFDSEEYSENENQQNQNQEDEEFDYSDFELEDENL